jgi:hypothetical protein
MYYVPSPAAIALYFSLHGLGDGSRYPCTGVAARIVYICTIFEQIMVWTCIYFMVAWLLFKPVSSKSPNANALQVI